MTLANERRALRAARTRGMRDQRRDTKPRRTTAQKDELREQKGKSTLVEQRGGLPSYTYARKQATHSDTYNPMRAFVQSPDAPNVFGCALRLKDTVPPVVGETIYLVPIIVTGPVQKYQVTECTAISSRMYTVAVRLV